MNLIARLFGALTIWCATAAFWFWSKGEDMNPFFSSLIGAGVRWTLTMLAARGVTVSDDTATQLIAGAIAIGTLVWSVIQKQRADEALQKAAATK